MKKLTILAMGVNTRPPVIKANPNNVAGETVHNTNALTKGLKTLTVPKTLDNRVTTSIWADKLAQKSSKNNDFASTPFFLTILSKNSLTIGSNIIKPKVAKKLN